MLQIRGRGAGCLYRPQYRARDGATKFSGIYWWKVGRYRVSTGCRLLEDAERWRQARLVEMGRGSLVGLKAAVLRWEDCERLLLQAHELEARRSHPESELRHLRQHFAGWGALDITPAACRAYAAKKRTEGYEVATVNLHLARLRRALRLAWQSGRLPSAPYVPLLPGARVRRGFLELGDLEHILSALAPKYRPLVRFLSLTGWRLGEGLGLTWTRVDRGAQEIRLDTSKSGEPRCVPYGTYPPLAALIEAQWKLTHSVSVDNRITEAQRTSGAMQPCENDQVGRGVAAPVPYGGPAVASGLLAYCRDTGLRRPSLLSPYVFPGRAGRPIYRCTVERAWRAACAEAGYPGILIHDLRRSFVRRAERCGVPRQVAMSLTGHQSEVVYSRYAISDRSAQQDALAAMAAEPVRSKVERIG